MNLFFLLLRAELLDQKDRPKARNTERQVLVYLGEETSTNEISLMIEWVVLQTAMFPMTGNHETEARQPPHIRDITERQPTSWELIPMTSQHSSNSDSTNSRELFLTLCSVSSLGRRRKV